MVFVFVIIGMKSVVISVVEWILNMVSFIYWLVWFFLEFYCFGVMVLVYRLELGFENLFFVVDYMGVCDDVEYFGIVFDVGGVGYWFVYFCIFVDIG